MELQYTLLFMAKLIYFMPTSLDGLIVGEGGNPDWSAPDEEVFAFLNDLVRPSDTYLYGRKMYETMSIWDSPDFVGGLPPAMQDFARVWQAAEKVVYSRTPESVSTARTRLVRELDAVAVRKLVDEASRDVGISGPNLAAHAIRAGIVDELQLLVVPVMLGGGKRVLPGDVYVKLELVEERRFGNGMVYLRYRARG